MCTIAQLKSLMVWTTALGLVVFAGVEPGLAQSAGNRGEFPGRRVGGGTRGDCAIDSRALAALNPASNLGVTASDRPSLYFAVPTAETRYHGQFILHDADQNRLYETTVAVGTEPIVGVHLPANLVAPAQDYHWYFVVACNPRDLSQNVVLEGWLRRVAPLVESTETPVVDSRLELAQAYQSAGLWSDAIAVMVELRQTHAQNALVQTQWNQLLHALELTAVVQ
ncbi:MAG TPA: DUF928 domain-containing protein [Nodosilinea sp.]|nr:DUF928 domain-containing protein [Nodosilinea sp.]